MSFSRIYAIFIRQWFLTRSNPTRLVGMFTWLILDIVLWGFLNKYIGSFGQATMSFTTVLLGALVLWEFTSQVERGVMMSFMEDIWANNFINYFASPLKVSEYAAGLVLSAISQSVVGGIVALLIVWAGFGYNLFKVGLVLFPFVIVLFVFAVALGLIVDSIIFRLGPSAEWLGWPIPFVISIFSGVYYPVSVLPNSLQMIAHALPTSYVFESARNILSTQGATPDVGKNLLIGGALALLYLFIAFEIFLAVYKRNLKHGNLSRFSAESL